MSEPARARSGRLVLTALAGAPAVLAARLSLTASGLVVAAGAVVGWIVARMLGAKAMYMMAYAAALFVAMAWVVGRKRLALRATRTGMPPRLREGQRVELELTISAERRVTTVLIEDRLHERIGTPFQVPVASIQPGEEHSFRYSLAPTQRGVFRVGPVTATWGDPFGCTVHSQVIAEQHDLIVHPATETAHDRVLTRMWEDPPVRPPVSKPWPVGFEFYGMRDYVPGDDLRRVVWSVVAKTGKMMVRESEQGITDRVVILLDTDVAHHSPGDPSDTFEAAVRVAASVGARHLGDGFSVTLLTNEGVRQRRLRGARSRLTYLDELARVQKGRAPLHAAGQTLLDEARTRPHVLVVTPHLDAAMTKHLRLVIERGVSVGVAMIAWEESDARSLGRAASIGCTVVQIPAGASIAAAFEHAVTIGGRR